LGIGRGSPIRCSGFSVGVVDFDPVPVRVLEVHLPNPVRPNGNVLWLTSEADIRHPVLLQASERRLEVSSRERHMRGELTGSLRFRVAADQVECPEAIDGEPPAFANPVGDFLKAKDVSIEGGTCIHVPYIERDMVQGEMIGHCQASLLIESRIGHGKSIRGITRHHHVIHEGTEADPNEHRYSRSVRKALPLSRKPRRR
jgi:hypothetical protein